ncbi:MAG: VWA domain-containing protein [Bdellovibrionales bacterium]|nr:VWA domain-containing protein [Bdellovibrionales bacterium]
MSAEIIDFQERRFLERQAERARSVFSLSEESFSFGNGRSSENPADLIEPGFLLELQIVAQQIAGDLGLEVTVGEPGQGSFFSFDPPLITLDPLQILADPERAKFVAGHEGAHRRFSPSPYDVFESRGEVDELYSQPGFHATLNTIEDCAVNDGMSREVVGMRDYTTQNYAKADHEGLTIRTPEIEAIVDAIGREPLFARALAETMRDWHRWRKEVGYDEPLDRVAREGRYGDGLPPSVVKALRNMKTACRKAIACMPKTGERNRDTIHALGRRRIEQVRQTVYPTIRRLVTEDISLEALRQALQERSAPGDSNGKPGTSALDGKLSQRTQDEIEKARSEFLADRAQAKSKSALELIDRLQQEKALQEEIEEQQQAGGGSGAFDHELRAQKAASCARTTEFKSQLEQISEGLSERVEQGETPSEEELAEQLKNELENNLQERGESPLPVDKLSKAALKEIEAAFDSLDEALKAEFTKQAEEQLAEFEHEIVEALRSKLDPDPVPTLHENLEDERKAQERAEEFAQRCGAMANLQRRLEKDRRSSLDAFERAFERVASAVVEATNRLQRVLIPQSFFTWKRDQLSGARLNLQRALQAEADPRYLTKLFEQRLKPTRRTHAFEVLVDTSGSMKGEKIKSTFDGVVFVAGLLENLGVPFEIHEFNDTRTCRKNWDDSVKEVSTRRSLSTIVSASDNGTQDAPAVSHVFSQLQARDANFKFIFVLTDAQSGVGTDLQRVVKKIQKSGEAILIHFGIGNGTSDSNGYYEHTHGDLSPEKFFSKLCEVVEEAILTPEKYLSENKSVTKK